MISSAYRGVRKKRHPVNIHEQEGVVSIEGSPTDTASTETMATRLKEGFSVARVQGHTENRE